MLKKKILIISFIFILLSFVFINNNVFATSSVNSITATCTTTNEHNGTELTYVLPSNVSSGSHLFTCWQGIYGKDALYVATEWTENTVFRLSNDYKYLYAYDTVLDKNYSFDIYLYNDGGQIEPYYETTLNYLYWNGVIYENGGNPNIYINTDPIYLNDMTLISPSSTNISFFPIPPTTLGEIMKVEQQEMKTLSQVIAILPLIIVVVVSLVGLRKALQMLSTLLHKA